MLAVSLAIVETVLRKSVQHVLEDKPSNVSFLAHLKRVRDPTLLAVLCEDAAACAGVVVVAGGMGASLLWRRRCTTAWRASRLGGCWAASAACWPC